MSVCCCDTPSTCCCTSPDTNYLVTIAGVTDGTRTGCTLLNTSLCLCYFACNVYQMRTSQFAISRCMAASPTYNSYRLTLQFDCTVPEAGTGSGTGTGPTGVVKLTIYGVCQSDDPTSDYSSEISATPIATYLRSRDSWNCGEANTMSLSSSESDCATWPSTISVTPSSSSIICNCQCRGDLTGVVGANFVYDVIIGAITPAGTGSCDGGDCGCDVIQTRICAKDLGGCRWYGIPILAIGSIYTYLSETHYYEECTPFPPANFFADGSFVPAVTDPYMYMLYDRATAKILVGWGSAEGVGAPDTFQSYTEVDISGLTMVSWEAYYGIDASSFDPTGDNVLTYIGGTYTKCQLPTTIQVNYFSNNNSDCDEASYSCSICTPETTPAGWSFTLSGISGPTFVRTPTFGRSGCTAIPCEVLNGDYCMGQGGTGCSWDTSAGTKPANISADPNCIDYPYSAANGGASLDLVAGKVTLRINHISHPSGACQYQHIYDIAATDFDCSGPNDLAYRCSMPFLASGDEISSDDACVCSGMPATITITPTSACGTEPPDPTCPCFPKSSYYPRVIITDIQDDATDCEECNCFDNLEICLEPYGTASECIWDKTFSYPVSSRNGYIPACYPSAVRAVLYIQETPYESYIALIIYDGSSNMIAGYRRSLIGFSCGTSGVTLYKFDGTNDSCEWANTQCTLIMNEGTCPACSPCDSDVSDPAIYAVHITYNSIQYLFCVSPSVNSCEYLSGAVVIEGESYYVYLEFGVLPTRYVRVSLYLSSGTGSGTSPSATDILIGVFNFLENIENFACDGVTNVLSLATGNAGQCGSDIDITGFTENLNASAFVRGDSVGDYCGGCTSGSSTNTGVGTTTVDVPSGATSVTIQTTAPGGGGRGRGLISGGGGGGGGGGTSITTLTGSVSGTYSLTNEAAGVGGGIGVSGTDGGDSYVQFAAADVCRAKGGKGSVSGTGGAGGSTTGAVGDTKYPGGSGGNTDGTGSSGGGGGGGSGGTASAGNNGANSSGGAGGAGGAAVTGGGAGGDGGDSSDSPDIAQDGSNPGGGGGGAGFSSGSSAGDGGRGEITISWVC